MDSPSGGKRLQGTDLTLSDGNPAHTKTIKTDSSHTMPLTLKSDGTIDLDALKKQFEAKQGIASTFDSTVDVYVALNKAKDIEAAQKNGTYCRYQSERHAGYG